MCTCSSEAVRAREVMTANVVCLNENLDLHECERMLVDNGISAAPVVTDDGQLLGVLSKTDLVMHHLESGDEEGGGDDSLRTEGIPGIHVFNRNLPLAREVMHPVPCTATEFATIGELAALMVRKEVHRIVICRDQKVVGIVSPMDLLRAIATEPGSETREGTGQAG